MAEDDGAVALTRDFLDAFNGRDLERAREAVSDSVELRNPRGKSLTGFDGVRDFLQAAVDQNIRLARVGDEQVEEDELDEVTRVTVPLRVILGEDELDGRGVFEIADGRISSFQVLTAED